MKAFGVTEYKPFGDLSALKAYEVPKPEATGRDLLVKVKAVATNPVDAKQLSNMGNPDAKFEGSDPLIVGYDGSGVVEEVGNEASMFKVGDEVMFAGDRTRPGSFAEYVLIDERIVALKPKNLTFSQAASAPLTALTAWEGLVDKLHVPEDRAKNVGKTILITGGAGGVATVAIEIAKKVLGLTVIATSSREESKKMVNDLGADFVVNHREPLPKQINDLGIQEVDYVFHSVDLSPELFDDFVTLLKPFGGLVCIRPTATVNLVALTYKSLSVSAEFMFARPMRRNEDSKRQHDILTKVAELTESGVLTCRANYHYSLTEENLRKALEFQVSGTVMGKITLSFE